MRTQRTTFRMVLGGLSVMCLLTWSSALMAQTRDMTDLRGKSYSKEDLGKALFPESSSTMRTRGIGPTSTATPAPETSVALNVFFETNSAAIRPEFHADLDKLGAVLTDPKYQSRDIEIEGHTDSVGSEAYNMNLSERRARSVRQYLVNKFGIAPQRVVVHGHGEDRPIARNDSASGRRQNRRVEVVNRGLQQ